MSRARLYLSRAKTVAFFRFACYDLKNNEFVSQTNYERVFASNCDVNICRLV